MALRATLNKADYDALDTALKGFYKADGADKFALDAEGMDDHPETVKLKRGIESERKKREDAARELAELKSKVGDLDTDAAREAMKRIKELEDKTALGEIPDKFKDQFEKAVNHRTESMKADFENQKKAFNKREEDGKKAIDGLNARLAELTIDNAVRAEAAKLGMHDWAVEDAVLHANRTYRLKDGQPVPFDGDQIIYGKEPNKPQPIAEWLADKVTQKPGWVKESTGGGAKNGNGTGRTTNGKFTIKREAARDRQQYLAAQEAAKKANAELVIVD